MHILSLIFSPKRTLDREWQRRERELYATLARGRKRRFERAMLDRK
jgi:hypothetical protein